MSDSKEKDKGMSKNFKLAMFIIGSALLGYFGGYFIGGTSDGLASDFIEKYLYNPKWYVLLLNVILMLLVFILGNLIHIVIHEAGHLIFGLISGYEFISFRVGSFTIIKEEDGFKFKRFNIPGTAGQCLMMPPKKADGKFPYILYNLGGGLLNIIVSLITILLVVYFKEVSLIGLSLLVISFAGLFIAVTNLLPLKIGGVANDGHNIMSMAKDEDSRDSFYLQLRVNGLQTKGQRIKDMPYYDFWLKDDIDYNNPLNFSRVFINHNYHLDNKDWKGAREALNFGQKYEDNMIGLYRLELDSELLFLELVDGGDSEKIEKLYNKDLRNHINNSKFMMNKKRLMMAYEGLYREDTEKTLKHFEDLKLLADIYPIKGERDMELMLGEYLKERILS